MEPAVDRREHGSRIRGPLSCENTGPCERSRKVGGGGTHMELSKCENLCWPACERSLGLDSPPQRSHSDDHIPQRRQFLMVSEEEKAR